MIVWREFRFEFARPAFPGLRQHRLRFYVGYLRKKFRHGCNRGQGFRFRRRRFDGTFRRQLRLEKSANIDDSGSVFAFLPTGWRFDRVPQYVAECRRQVFLRFLGGQRNAVEILRIGPGRAADG